MVTGSHLIPRALSPLWAFFYYPRPGCGRVYPIRRYRYETGADGAGDWHGKVARSAINRDPSRSQDDVSEAVALAAGVAVGATSGDILRAGLRHLAV